MFVLLLLSVVSCRQQNATMFGRPAEQRVSTVAAVREAASSQNVTLSGVMIEKCPVAGCWFRLRDKTGIIKVDTKSGGFAVVNVPLAAKVIVSGKIVAAGAEITLDATGLRY